MRNVLRTLIFIFLLAFLPAVAAVHVHAATPATLQVMQTFVTSDGASYSTDQQVTYTLTGNTVDDPMPNGAAGSSYAVTLAGNDSQNIIIDYPTAGVYEYTITEEIPSAFVFTWTPTTYDITVYADGSGTPVVIMKNSAGDKVSALHWNYVYPLEPAPPEPDPSEPDPSDPDPQAPNYGEGERPQTGDDSRLLLWIVLGGAAAGILILGILLIRRRK